MKDKTKDPNDISVSALDCGCDPRENYKCEIHRKDKKCVMGHWNRFDNCPACQVLVKENNK